MHGHHTNDHRRDAREESSSALLWSRHPAAVTRVGWLLESSHSGLAFAWRGDDAPNAGDRIWIRAPNADAGAEPTPATVRRATHAHADLVVVAAERLDDASQRTAINVLPARPARAGRTARAAA
ncbi:MAG: hypothetical protein AAGH64_06150 [Planctomycetota bacterium]